MYRMRNADLRIVDAGTGEARALAIRVPINKKLSFVVLMQTQSYQLMSQDISSVMERVHPLAIRLKLMLSAEFLLHAIVMTILYALAVSRPTLAMAKQRARLQAL